MRYPVIFTATETNGREEDEEILEVVEIA